MPKYYSISIPPKVELSVPEEKFVSKSEGPNVSLPALGASSGC